MTTLDDVETADEIFDLTSGDYLPVLRNSVIKKLAYNTISTEPLAATVTDNPGVPRSLHGGDGNGTGQGGNVDVRGGDGGTGGGATVAGGDALDADNVGGLVHIHAGVSAGTGNGNTVQITGGEGGPTAGTGGTVAVTAGPPGAGGTNGTIEFYDSVFNLMLKVGPTSNALGFFGTAPTTKPTVTGSKASGAAFDSLLAALVSLGLITDSTSA